MKVPPMVISQYLSMCNGSCIKCSFYDVLIIQRGSYGQWEFLDSSFTPHFMIVITCNDDLRNLKGLPGLVVAFEIPFLSHLL